MGSMAGLPPATRIVIHTLKRALGLLIAAGLLSAVAAAQSYCECSPGLGPCGNDAGSSLPGGCWNSLQAKGFMGPIGSTSVSADDLLFTSFNFPAKSPLLLFMGPEPVQRPFGDGLLCVGPGSVGYSNFAPKFSSAIGNAVWGPGIAGYAKSHFPQAAWIQPGQTWYFQVWYRDPMGPCGEGSNLTNGLGMTFTP